MTISIGKKLWIAGINNNQYSSITSIENNFSKVRNFLETNYSGFFRSDFYSSEYIDGEVWFGSDGKVVIYDERNDFFRTLGYEKGIPIQKIEFIKYFNDKIEETFIWPMIRLKCLKYKSFFSYDKQRFKQIVVDFFTE